jgi:endonuclease YncB( thermonuclease family)
MVCKLQDMFCWKFIIKRIKCPCFGNNNSSYGTFTKITIDDELANIEYKDTKRFVPPITHGKVIKVYDGDTITIASRIPNSNLPMYRFSVRLSGIDSAEIKGHTEAEKIEAKKARDALNGLIYGKIVHLENVTTEKYGRILADVYLDNLHINQWMLNNNYAVPYDGGKKERPDEWDSIIPNNNNTHNSNTIN